MQTNERRTDPGTGLAIGFGLAFIAGVISWLVYQHGNLKYMRAMSEVITYASVAPLAAGAGYILGAFAYNKKAKTTPTLRRSADTLAVFVFFVVLLAGGIFGASVFEGMYYTDGYAQLIKAYKPIIYIIGIGAGVYALYKVAELFKKEKIAIRATKTKFAPVRKRRLNLKKATLPDGTEIDAIYELDSKEVELDTKIKARKYIAKHLAKRLGIDEPTTESELLRAAELAGERKIDIPLGYLYGWDPEMAGAIESVYRGRIRKLGEHKANTYYALKTKKGGENGKTN